MLTKLRRVPLHLSFPCLATFCNKSSYNNQVKVQNNQTAVVLLRYSSFTYNYNSSLSAFVRIFSFLYALGSTSVCGGRYYVLICKLEAVKQVFKSETFAHEAHLIIFIACCGQMCHNIFMFTNSFLYFLRA